MEVNAVRCTALREIGVKEETVVAKMPVVKIRALSFMM